MAVIVPRKFTSVMRLEPSLTTKRPHERCTRGVQQHGDSAECGSGAIGRGDEGREIGGVRLDGDRSVADLFRDCGGAMESARQKGPG